LAVAKEDSKTKA